MASTSDQHRVTYTNLAPGTYLTESENLLTAADVGTEEFYFEDCYSSSLSG